MCSLRWDIFHMGRQCHFLRGRSKVRQRLSKASSTPRSAVQEEKPTWNCHIPGPWLAPFYNTIGLSSFLWGPTSGPSSHSFSDNSQYWDMLCITVSAPVAIATRRCSSLNPRWHCFLSRKMFPRSTRHFADSDQDQRPFVDPIIIQDNILQLCYVIKRQLYTNAGGLFSVGSGAESREQ